MGPRPSSACGGTGCVGKGGRPGSTHLLLKRRRHAKSLHANHTLKPKALNGQCPTHDSNPGPSASPASQRFLRAMRYLVSPTRSR